MIDTNIFDKIVATRGMTWNLRRLVRKGTVTILTTHVQEDELADIPSRWLRFRVGRVPHVRIPTSEFVWNASRLDQARLGTGQPFEEIRGSVTHTKDGLIAATAYAEADVLVTEEGRLRRRAAAACPNLVVWDFDDFRRCGWRPIGREGRQAGAQVAWRRNCERIRLVAFHSGRRCCRHGLCRVGQRHGAALAYAAHHRDLPGHGRSDHGRHPLGGCSPPAPCASRRTATLINSVEQLERILAKL
jgi:hypothetical protein